MSLRVLNLVMTVYRSSRVPNVYTSGRRTYIRDIQAHATHDQQGTHSKHDVRVKFFYVLSHLQADKAAKKRKAPHHREGAQSKASHKQAALSNSSS